MTGQALIGRGNCVGDGERDSAVLIADEVFFFKHPLLLDCVGDSVMASIGPGRGGSW